MTPNVIQLDRPQEREAPVCSFGPCKVLVVALGSGGAIPVDTRGAAVLVVAPALNSWLRHWLSDEDAARGRAAGRAAAIVERLRLQGLHAESRIGDPDPMLAIADALRIFPADEIVFVGEPERPNRLARDLLARVRRSFPLPVLDPLPHAV